MKFDLEGLEAEAHAIRAEMAGFRDPEPWRPKTPTLRVKRLHPEARLPTYATDGAAGMDLYAHFDGFESMVIDGGSMALIRTGIAIEIPPGYEGQVRPRSGLSRQGIVAVLGTVDADYRGEVGVIVSCQRASEYEVRRGDRIAQLVIAKCERATVVETDKLSETVRGGAGFGSTGK